MHNEAIRVVAVSQDKRLRGSAPSGHLWSVRDVYKIARLQCRPGLNLPLTCPLRLWHLMA